MNVRLIEYAIAAFVALAYFGLVAYIVHKVPAQAVKAIVALTSLAGAMVGLLHVFLG